MRGTPHSLSDLPFKHKGIAALLGLLYGPLTHALLKTYSTIVGDNFHPLETEIQEYYIKLGILGYACNYYWLSLLGKIKKPRVKNSLRATATALEVIIANLRNNPEQEYAKGLAFFQTTSYLDDSHLHFLNAGYSFQKGRLEDAVEHYARYLDERKNRDKTIDEYISLPLTAKLIRTRAYFRGTIPDLLAEAFLDLTEQRPLEKTWKKILQKYPTIEMHVLHALFLSIARAPEAKDLWYSIAENPELPKNKLGEPRNTILEIALPHLGEIAIIKKGTALEQEWKILRTLQKEEKEKITVTPLAFYEQEGIDVLITKRKPLKTLEEVLSEKTKEEKEQACTHALNNLARLHSHSHINVPSYNPLAEFHRRILNRFTDNEHARELRAAYHNFYERSEDQNHVLSHGDFYPSNVLENGILLDLEKVCNANPWLDLETFLSAPQWNDLDTETISTKAYTKPLSEKGRDFYRIHTTLCQIGSFWKKQQDTAQYFLQQTQNRLGEQQEQFLKEKLNIYIEKNTHT